MLTRIKKILSNKKGVASIPLTMGLILFCSLIIFLFAFYGFASTRINKIKATSQKVLDVYTSTTGKEIMESIKSGHDYTKNIDEEKFLKEFQKQLETRVRFQGYNQDNDFIFEIKDIKVNFIYDKRLKTDISYTLVYHCYFMSDLVYSQEFNIKQEGRYNLK